MKIVLPCTPIAEAEFYLGAVAGWLAFQTDEIQATFFNEFDTQLRRACDVRTGGSVYTQCMHIGKYLSNDAAITLESIAAK